MYSSFVFLTTVGLFQEIYLRGQSGNSFIIGGILIPFFTGAQ